MTKSHRQLLELLTKRQVVTHKNLHDALYWRLVDREKPKMNVIHTFIWQLRQKLPPGSIEKVWGVGYRMSRDALKE